jgi:predicted SnoaL-like aldol condensation-catalyzing enzyme
MSHRESVRWLPLPAAVLIGLCLACTAALADTPAQLSPKAVVTAFSHLIESHQALEGVDRYVASDFVEHDPAVAGGNRDGMIQYLKDHGWTQPSAVKSDIHIDRIIAAGEYVVVHQHLRRGPDQPVLVFVDIFRVRDGRIAEHWDVMQPVPAQPANTQHTMY